MLEALIYYFLQRALGSILENKGYDSIFWRILFVVCGLSAEVGGIVTALNRGLEPHFAVVYAVLGVLGVVILFFGIALCLPSRYRSGRTYSSHWDSDGEPEDIEKFREARRRAAKQKRELRERREREERRRRMPIKALPELPEEDDSEERDPDKGGRQRRRARDGEEPPRRRSKD
jgi:hypothetical protein